MRPLLCLLAAVLFSCATTPPPIASDKQQSPWRGVPREDLQITAESVSEKMESHDILIYGSGVAVWDNRVQFRVNGLDIHKILQAFEASDFERIPERSPRGKRLRRRAAIKAGSYSRQAFQTWEAPEGEALKALVDSIFAVVTPIAERGGVTADSVNDGLRKIASGQLAPEMLSVMVHLKPSAGSKRGEGFLFGIEDGKASSRRYVNGSLGDPVEQKLRESTIRELATRLLSFDPDSLPINLYAPDYTEVIIRVMNQRQSVLARQFANLTPATHGEKQSRFDRLLESLEQTQRELSLGETL